MADGATVWSRADRPSRMIVDYATTKSFPDAKRIDGPFALEATDYTSRVRLSGVAPGQTVFYRVSFLDLGDLKSMSEPEVGRFRMPPAANNDVSFVWSGDTVGQGCGINPELGGMKIYEAMRKLTPDFFVHCGDTIYADGPLEAEKKLPDGKVWRNIVTEAKSKVAETLAEFRGVHRYNFLDDNLRRFNADVPMLAQWDDHEVVNNWYWEKRLDADKRYSEKSVAVLAAYAQRAFREYMPLSGGLDTPMQLARRFSFGPRLDLFRIDMRSYRGPNGENRQTSLGPASAFLGSTQLEWLKGALKGSKATWKIVAADMPLGLVVYDNSRARTGSDAVANGDNGAPLGRELEIADLLAFIKREHIRNVHWITADVHYAATHRYDPESRAVRRLPAVLRVRLGAALRRRLRPQRARQDLRPGRRVPARRTRRPIRDRAVRGRLPLRACQDRRQERRHDGHPSRRLGRRPARHRSRAGLNSPPSPHQRAGFFSWSSDRERLP